MPLPGIEHRFFTRPARSLVTVTTDLPRVPTLIQLLLCGVWKDINVSVATFQLGPLTTAFSNIIAFVSGLLMACTAAYCMFVMFVRRQTISAPDTVCVLTALDGEAAATLWENPTRKVNSSGR